MVGFKGRVARMLLNFLDEHGNYRESLEEAAARAAAAEANSLLARQEKKRGRKKGRRSRGNNLLSEEDDDDDEWDEDEVQPKISQSPPNNGLPEDPYEQIQFYFQTFKSRTSSQLQQKLHSYQSSTVHWIHGELHHNEHVSTASLLIFMISLVSFISKRRSKTYGMYKRIHAILGKKFQWRSYLHRNFIRGVVLYQLSSESIPKLEKLRSKAAKAEEVALQSMRPYQRRRYERLNLLEVWGERVVMTVLVCGMVLSGMTFCMSLYNLILGSGMMIRIGGFTFGPFTTNGVDESMTDGYIYSLDGETDYDGYPLHLRDMAERRYAECIVDAEMGGNDPKELCDLNAFFGDAAANNVPKSILRAKINALLNQIGIPPALSSYLTALPNQTLAYLSSLFTLCLFVLSHYISHKIHIATMSNDPMKHFVVVDKTVKADGTVEAKKGETEAQRKKRERLLQAERYKAQMAQLAYEAKTKAQARIARLEGKEAAKREEEEKEKKAIEEQDETVKLYGRQFMMIKAGVPDGAILNSFVPMGIEGDEAKEILTKLHEIKERRSAEAKKAEEEEAKKAEQEKKEEEMKDRIAADRLKKLKSGKLPRTSTLPSSSTANAALKRKNSLPLKLPKPVEKTGEEMTEEAKRETEKAPGVKVVQPWASPSKKEKRGAKNKRWDKVTKSWVDRDLETDGADAVPTSVVLKKDEGEEEDMDYDLAVPVVEKKPQSAPQPAKVEVDKTALRASLMSQLRNNSPSPDQSNQRSVPRRVSLDKKDSSKDAVPATTDKVEVVEQKYDAKNFNPISERTNTEKSEETKVTSQASSQSSSPPPVLLRVTESPDDDVFAPRALDVASPWSRRSSARDIKAMIEAVEAAPEDQAEELFLGPNNFHSPAFETAMRASNSSWDKRPSSSDILEKIRAAEQQGANAEADKALRRSTTKPPKGRMTRIDEGKNMTRHLRPNDDTDCKIGTSLLKKTRSQGGINSDDEISEISMVDELSVTSATFVNTPKGTPKQLKKTIRVTEKELCKIPRLDTVDKSNVAKTKDEASEAGTVVTGKSKNSASKSEPREETEEERLRKKKAEERAKKFEAMNARRRKGKGNDDGTAVSGISRRQRIRRKRSALAAITPEEKKRDDWKKGIFASVLNVEQKRWKKSIYAHVINAEETRAANIKAQQDLEELNAAAKRRIENQKRLDAKARKFAARAEKFHKLRRSDDGSVVSSASRMRRRRTRKSGVDTPPRRSAASSSEALSVNENSATPCQQPTSIVDVVEQSLPKQREAKGVQVTGVSMELIKENETDTIAVTEQKDASTAESSDQRNAETDDKVAIGLEEKVEVKHSVEEVNAVLNSANSEPLPVDEKAIPAAEQSKGKTDGQLDDIVALSTSSNEVVDQPVSEKGAEDTLISASNDEEKKTEPESETSLPKTPTSPIKKFKNRRRAAAKKKKKGST